MTDGQLEPEANVCRREISSKIGQAEEYMKKLEVVEEKDAHNLQIGIELASIYAHLSGLYTNLAAITPKGGDYLTDAKRYLQDASVEIGEFVDLRYYEASRNDILKMMETKIPGLANKFDTFQKLFNNARSNITSITRGNSRLEAMLAKNTTIQLNDEQAYLLAESIKKAAKIADSDGNYGGGTDKREETVMVHNLRKEEYYDLIKNEIETAEGLIEKSGENIFQKVGIKYQLEKLNGLKEWIESCPSNTFFSLPEGSGIEVKIGVGSDLDRKYWQFIYHIIADSGVKRVSPAIQRAHNEMKSYILTSSKSLCVNSEIYKTLQKEFPFLGYLDNPIMFQELLETATQSGGEKLIFQALTGKNPDAGSKISYLAQKLGGVIGLPNTEIDGR